MKKIFCVLSSGSCFLYACILLSLAISIDDAFFDKLKHECPESFNENCWCIEHFFLGDLTVTVICSNVTGDPQNFFDELQALRGYRIDELEIIYANLTYLPDSPFVEMDGRTPITSITRVKLAFCEIYGFGDPNSSNLTSFFDALGYSLVEFTVEDAPFLGEHWEWERFANSLMAVALPIEELTTVITDKTDKTDEESSIMSTELITSDSTPYEDTTNDITLTDNTFYSDTSQDIITTNKLTMLTENITFITSIETTSTTSITSSLQTTTILIQECICYSGRGRFCGGYNDDWLSSFCNYGYLYYCEDKNNPALELRICPDLRCTTISEGIAIC